jgi:hypothetical protein
MAKYKGGEGEKEILNIEQGMLNIEVLALLLLNT